MVFDGSDSLAADAFHKSAWLMIYSALPHLPVDKLPPAVAVDGLPPMVADLVADVAILDAYQSAPGLQAADIRWHSEATAHAEAYRAVQTRARSGALPLACTSLGRVGHLPVIHRRSAPTCGAYVRLSRFSRRRRACRPRLPSAGCRRRLPSSSSSVTRFGEESRVTWPGPDPRSCMPQA
jgi:hypothetical protein